MMSRRQRDSAARDETPKNDASEDAVYDAVLHDFVSQMDGSYRSQARTWQGSFVGSVISFAVAIGSSGLLRNPQDAIESLFSSTVVFIPSCVFIILLGTWAAYAISRMVYYSSPQAP